MVTLVVATTTDPASFGPASALSAIGIWTPGVSFQGIRSKVNGDVRLLEHDQGIVEEDYLDDRWEEVTGEIVNEIIFLSKHTAVTNRPVLTVHPIGNSAMHNVGIAGSASNSVRFGKEKRFTYVLNDGDDTKDCACVNCLAVLKPSKPDNSSYLFTWSHDGTLKRWELNE